MITIAINELSTVGELLKQIEKGEACILTKEGEPVAELLPLTVKEPIWKRKIKKVRLASGTKTTTEVLREIRDEE